MKANLVKNASQTKHDSLPIDSPDYILVSSMGDIRRVEGMEAKVIYSKTSDTYDNEKYDGIMGGDDSNPTWEEYLANFSDDFAPYLKAIRESIEKNQLVGKMAGDICNDIHFEFEDGKKIGFSWRGWGDLMQAIVNKREGYMTYYM